MPEFDFEAAKEFLKTSVVHYGRVNGKFKAIQFMKTALFAIEKQIPNTPDFEGDGYDENGNIILDTWICPCCDERYETDYEVYKYCPNCGQAIDWS